MEQTVVMVVMVGSEPVTVLGSRVTCSPGFLLAMVLDPDSGGNKEDEDDEEEEELKTRRNGRKKKKRTLPGTVMVVSAQPKQCIEYVDVAVVFHTVTVAAVLVVTTPCSVQLGQDGATKPWLRRPGVSWGWEGMGRGRGLRCGG